MMSTFKVNIGDPKTGKSVQKEFTEQAADRFVGLNIGETIQGDVLDLPGYEFSITGGSDTAGFPMRRGILGLRKRILIQGGVGLRKTKKGEKRRKTITGHKIHQKIAQINVKILKYGKASLFESKEEGKPEEKKEEQAPTEKQEQKKEEKKVKEKKEPEQKPQEKQEAKPQEKKEPSPKSEEKKEQSQKADTQEGK